ncbi:divalent-cation tolerance protein CutA [Candidatus Oleimmundimicrobium sp.]|uniref:divalent-cation tolerance protein CutA n=1 Tax=Candidatus Oleimmundimicrobium sp. TaxID=3060597 RepID=UPI0027263478|nr:divalent-cation tolerance protein CutA [Candidatus Oleimmundimicrobium sp.]MDO8886549.1 divalent-cation tolerance protein CutA [Candidatus Oleimmundimicrobium sp.]
MSCFLIYITAKDIKEARSIAHDLLEKRLVACVNIIPGVESYYWWKGNICESTEALLFVKTTEDRVKDVVSEVKNIHSYDVPAISAIKISAGNAEFFNWVKDETGDFK